METVVTTAVQPRSPRPRIGATGTPSPWNQETLAAHFATQAMRTPNAPALESDGTVLSYGVLDARATAVAAALQEAGAGPDARVGIHLDRGLEQVVALLGVLKAGAAYVPLETGLPRQRLQALLSDADLSAVVTAAALAPPLVTMSARTICIEQLSSDPAELRPVATRSGHLAYVIYTSGSTGRPKGVAVTQGAALALWRGLAANVYAHLPGGPHRVAMNGPLAFDTSVKQWLQLLSGHTLCVVPESVRHDPVAFIAFLERSHIDVLDCTPSQLRPMLDAGLLAAGSTALLIAGEPIAPSTWQMLRGAAAIKSFNLYGPTECTVDATVGLVSTSPTPTIGTALPHVSVTVRDAAGELVPAGVVGELYIGGAGVARGYWGQPALTADAYMPDPYSMQPGGRAFRSGDRVRWRGDGTLEFVGRTDNQIKLRGYRIELSEIEATLRRHRAVNDAIVVLREQGASRQLVAYATAAPAVSGETLRSWLAEYLPEYMVPSAVMALAAWPLTVNGKIDRASLPAPDLEHRTDTYVAPRTQMETTLAELWTEVLNVPQIGVHDNFFELGGDSIMSIQVIARAAKRGIRVAPQMIFKYPTLGELAAAIVESAARVGPANPTGR